MSTATKIAVIGAGSAQFSLKVVRDLCLTESLWGSEVCFMDLDRDRLEFVRDLAVRYANEIGADLWFQISDNRKDALQDTAFVINTAYVKGHGHEWAMRDAAAKHGYFYDGVQLGEYYQLRLALDLARDMEQICPDAWLLQVGNPVFDCSTLISRESSIKVCGLCHGHYGVDELAEIIGLDPKRVSSQSTGFNHNIWLTHFFYDGEDAYPLIDQWIEEQSADYWRGHDPESTHDIQASRAAVYQYRMYGLFPIGDTIRRVGAGPSVGCTGYRGDWWFHTDMDTKKYWFGEKWGGPDTYEGRRYFEKRLSEMHAEIHELAQNPKASVVDAVGATMSKEAIIPVVDGLTNDNEGQYQLNVPNQGVFPDIPDDVIVEVPAIVSKKGIQPLHVGAMPRKIMLMCILPHWIDMERNLLAFKTGDPAIPLWNALDSHQTRSLDQAVAVLEELMNLDGHEDLRAHYGPLGALRNGA
jgi:alpha-galactosidase